MSGLEERSTSGWTRTDLVALVISVLVSAGLTFALEEFIPESLALRVLIYICLMLVAVRCIYWVLRRRR